MDSILPEYVELSWSSAPSLANLPVAQTRVRGWTQTHVAHTCTVAGCCKWSTPRLRPETYRQPRTRATCGRTESPHPPLENYPLETTSLRCVVVTCEQEPTAASCAPFLWSALSGSGPQNSLDAEAFAKFWGRLNSRNTRPVRINRL